MNSCGQNNPYKNVKRRNKNVFSTTVIMNYWIHSTSLIFHQIFQTLYRAQINKRNSTLICKLHGKYVA
jgi:hypothetical protein